MCLSKQHYWTPKTSPAEPLDPWVRPFALHELKAPGKNKSPNATGTFKIRSHWKKNRLFEEHLLFLKKVVSSISSFTKVNLLLSHKKNPQENSLSQGTKRYPAKRSINFSRSSKGSLSNGSLAWQITSSLADLQDLLFHLFIPPRRFKIGIWGYGTPGKGNHLPNHHFQVPYVNLPGGTLILFHWCELPMFILIIMLTTKATTESHDVFSFVPEYLQVTELNQSHINVNESLPWLGDCHSIPPPIRIPYDSLYNLPHLLVYGPPKKNPHPQWWATNDHPMDLEVTKFF